VTLNRRKFWIALLSVIVALGWVLPIIVNWACRGCFFRYTTAMVFGKASHWPLYAANVGLYAICAIGASLLAKRRGRRPWVWALACLPFSIFAVCYLYALEPSGDETTLAEDLNNAPLWTRLPSDLRGPAGMSERATLGGRGVTGTHA